MLTTDEGVVRSRSMGTLAHGHRVDIDLDPLLETEITALIDAAEDARAHVLITDQRCTLVFEREEDRAEFCALWCVTFR
jgi:hypothetical protein